MSAIREITLAEVKQHNKPADLWVVIEEKVYDLTKFRSEHPGGEESLDDVAGKNATKEFIEVGHSSDAREMMGKYLIGEVAAADRKNKLPISLVASLLYVKETAIGKSGESFLLTSYQQELGIFKYCGSNVDMEIGIAVGAVVIGIATVFIIRQVLVSRN